MSIAPATLTPTALTNQIQVQVSVRDRRLDVYPKRAHDVVLYFVDPQRASAASPAKPHEVRWVVEGLTTGLSVAIETDPTQAIDVGQVRHATPLSPVRAELHRFIGSGVHTALSGPPSRSPGRGHESSWKYDVVLYDGNTEIDRIDPTVIIKEDP